APDDDALSDWRGRRGELRCTDHQDVRRYENVSDFENEPTSAWEPFDGAGGAFHDIEGATVSLLSTASIGDWDRRRFRPNLLLDGSGEDDLVGSRVRTGAAVLAVNAPIERCVMTTRPQPGDIDRDLDVLRTIHRQRGGRLAVGAVVVSPGQVRVGDELVGQE
ncbi:MAG: MOSC domain-containing protein, partial [Actinomycetota bacterium]|nr:MOSC domain-containing protein [Actinomycetota bacterium]